MSPSSTHLYAHAEFLVKHGEAEEGEIHAVGYGCDVSNENSVKETFSKIESEFGGKIDASPMYYTLPLRLTSSASFLLLALSRTSWPTNTPRRKSRNCLMSMSWDLGIALWKLPSGCQRVDRSFWSDRCLVPWSMCLNLRPLTTFPVRPSRISRCSVANVAEAAVRHMARSLAVEWASQNIRVNCLS